MHSNQEEFCEQLNEVYDLYRTASMNHKYHAYKLASCSKWNSLYEVTVALGSSTSALAVWPVWKTEGAKPIWLAFTGLVGVLVVLKPFLRLSQRVEQYSQLYVGYKELYQDLKKVVYTLRIKKRFTRDMEKLFSNALNRAAQLDRIGVVTPSKKLRQKSYDEVNREIPVESLWYPDYCLARE